MKCRYCDNEATFRAPQNPQRVPESWRDCEWVLICTAHYSNWYDGVDGDPKDWPPIQLIGREDAL